MMIFVLYYIFLIHSASTQRACNLYCDERFQSGPTLQSFTRNQGSPGKRGPMGLRGEKGQKGDICGYNCTVLDRLSEKIDEIEKNGKNQNLIDFII